MTHCLFWDADTYTCGRPDACLYEPKTNPNCRAARRFVDVFAEVRDGVARAAATRAASAEVRDGAKTARIRADFVAAGKAYCEAAAQWQTATIMAYVMAEVEMGASYDEALAAITEALARAEAEDEDQSADAAGSPK